MALVRPPVSYPGVYIQEVESDVHTITPVDTATTAFIGRALRGPVNEPVVCNGFADFQRIFGGLWLDSNLGYAVNDFFLNGGAKAVIVRLFHAEVDQATRDAADAIISAIQGKTGADAKKAATAAASKYADPGPVHDAVTNIVAEIQKLNDADTAETVLAAVQKAKATYAPSVLSTLTIQNSHPAAQAVARAVAGGTDLAKMKVAADAQAKTYSAAADTAAATAVKTAIDAATTPAEVQAKAKDAVLQTHGNALALQSRYEGVWGNRLVARITDIGDAHVLTTLAAQQGVNPGELFNLTIRDTKTGAEEYFPNVTVVNGPRQLGNVLAHQSEFVQVGNQQPAPANANGLQRPGSHPAPASLKNWWEDPDAHSVVVADGMATDGLPLVDLDFEGDQAAKQGIYALEHADIFNMLCIPPYEAGAEDVNTSVLAQAVAYCQKRRAILIVDPPSDWSSKDKAIKGFPIPQLSPTSYAAVFFPRIREADPLRDNQINTFVPCGAIAGIMARTDFRRGVWKAAAGLEATLNGVAGLTVPLTDAENGELNPLGINCLRSLPAVGPVVWGARTLEGDDRLASQWKYVPVRRMALWIEETLYRSTQWAVFEPNDEPLWSSLRLNIGVFMNDLFRQGAFQGQSAKDAYFVKCDSATTPQADIDRGIVNVIVGFAPLKPAEFVILYIQQITGNLAV